MQPDGYPLKHIRLGQLEDDGFNVADWICFPPRELDLQRLREFFDRHGRISCRHFADDERRQFKCPVRYDLSDFEEIAAFCSEHNQQYWTLCNEAIKLDDSIFAGNILLLDDRDFLVEYFEGPGTPRDTEHKRPPELRVFRREFGVPLPPGTPQELVAVASCFRNFLSERRPIILEFSIYPYPIGKRQRRDIFWEWRLGWIHDYMELVQMLLGRVADLEATVRTLTRMEADEITRRRHGATILQP